MPSIGRFLIKWKRDTAYRNKEEEVGLLKYLEELPSEKLSNYLFKKQSGSDFYQ